jgi:hypothetical protein
VVFNEVEAVVQRLVAALKETEPSLIQEGSILHSVFTGRNSFAVSRKNLWEGQGVGEVLVRRYLGRGDEAYCPRTKVQVQEAIAAVKSPK